MNAYKKSKAFHPQQQHPEKSLGLKQLQHQQAAARQQQEQQAAARQHYIDKNEDVSSNTAKNGVDELQELMKKINNWYPPDIEAPSTSAGDVGNASMPPTSAEKNAYSRRINGTGGQKQQRGNKKNKPKIYKNKIILGKERGIYKIPGSRKDYIKYKGEFIAVNDYIKLKNK